MQNEQELSREKSLEIIHQMISNAKSNIKDNGAGWLVWGSMIFLASLATFFFVEMGYHNLFLAWNIFGLVAIVLLAYEFFRSKKKVVRTYVDDILKWVDIAFMVSLFVIIISMNVSVRPNDGFGFLLMIYAFLMLVQGGALQFRPLIIGAVVNWCGALGIFFCTEFKYDMLISAAAVFIGYIIPGLLLRAQYKKTKLIS